MMMILVRSSSRCLEHEEGEFYGLYIIATHHIQGDTPVSAAIQRPRDWILEPMQTNWKAL